MVAPVCGREQRLRRPADFAAVFNDGRGRSNNLLALRMRPNDLAYSRAGYSVSKRVGKAVIRNRVKRRLRAIMHGVPLAPGWDVVISARPGAARATYTELATALHELLGRARLLAGVREAE